MGLENEKRLVQAQVEGVGMRRSLAAQKAGIVQQGAALLPPMPMTEQEMRWQREWSSIVLRQARSEWDQRARAWMRLGQVELPSPRTSFALGALWRAEASDVLRAAEAREASLAAGVTLEEPTVGVPRVEATAPTPPTLTEDSVEAPGCKRRRS